MARPSRSVRRPIAVCLAAIAVLCATTLALAQPRVITANVSIEQDQLAAGAYTVNEVVQAGRQFFAQPYLHTDGHGEGRTGPRASQREAQWADAVTGPGTDIPFLRVNGIDSQACFACHNSAGVAVPTGQIHSTQKPGGVGGSADFASVLLGNEFFPDDPDFTISHPLASEEAFRLTHVVRAPPKAFGTAYIQELALEMTRELEEQEQQATAQAAFTGSPVTVKLSAKGISFGKLTITCLDSYCKQPIRNTSSLQGISPDLIVRPFQHKGVTATLRSFTKTALDFHFSMQPVEVVGIDTDCDADGRFNEMAVDTSGFAATVGSRPVQQSLGNVAALAAFTGMLRPPVSNDALSTREARGKELFAQIGCTSCHVSTLNTRPRPQFRIELAKPASGCPDASVYGGRTPKLGSFAEADGDIHPAKQTVSEQKQAETESQGQLSVCPNGFYCIDLTTPGSLPSEFNPRLPANADATVTVPLYSDLKRHDLGPYLAQVTPEQADDGGHEIPNQEWLTTKLWGVADNGPWLHDGRARTLHQAIIMHDGGNGNQQMGEAQQEVDAYQALTSTDRQDIILFLRSLSVPPA